MKKCILLILVFSMMIICGAVGFAEVAPAVETASWAAKALKWIMENYGSVFTAVLGLVGVAEIITRFTKTKKDDGAVERIGKIIKGIMDFLKIPNRTTEKRLK